MGTTGLGELLLENTVVLASNPSSLIPAVAHHSATA
jgi:hypothetical protein